MGCTIKSNIAVGYVITNKVLREKAFQALYNDLTYELEDYFHPVDYNDEDSDEQIEVGAACYVEGPDGTGDLQEIETDEEWELIEDALGQFDEECCEGECGCGCGHEHCHCEDGTEVCECDDDCDCEEGHCCCCHHEEEK